MFRLGGFRALGRFTFGFKIFFGNHWPQGARIASKCNRIIARGPKRREDELLRDTAIMIESCRQARKGQPQLERMFEVRVLYRLIRAFELETLSMRFPYLHTHIFVAACYWICRR